MIAYEAPALYRKIQDAKARGDSKGAEDLQRELDRITAGAIRSDDAIQDDGDLENLQKRVSRLEYTIGFQVPEV